jgi:nucleoside-diphosphate-sugar epimerase
VTDGPRRALVTGATGFVASRLARRLQAEGWDVTGLVRDTTVDLPFAVEAWPTGGEEAVALFERTRPDVCFHLATRFQSGHQAADVVALVEGNVTLAALVGQGAAATRCPVVYTSTYWQHHGGAAYSPTSLYAAMKQAAMDVLRYYNECEGVPVLALSLYNTYGPGEPAHRITTLLVRSAIDGTPLALSPGEQLIDLLHVDDVVDALTVAAERFPADRGADDAGWQAWCARSAAPLSLVRLAEVVADVVGRPPAAEFGARPYRPREMFELWEVEPPLPGWAPRTTLPDGLAELHAHLAGR